MPKLISIRDSKNKVIVRLEQEISRLKEQLEEARTVIIRLTNEKQSLAKRKAYLENNINRAIAWASCQDDKSRDDMLIELKEDLMTSKDKVFSKDFKEE